MGWRRTKHTLTVTAYPRTLRNSKGEVMDLNALIYNPNPHKNQYTLKAKIYSGEDGEEKRNIRKKKVMESGYHHRCIVCGHRHRFQDIGLFRE